MLDRASVVDTQFLKRVSRANFPEAKSLATPAMVGLDKKTAIELFDSQVKSRLLDIIARQLKDKGLSFYTIGSSGHEGNAVFGHVFKSSDMAFLHYRSNAFYLQRAKQVQGCDGVRDILLSLVAAAEDPIAGGRHKVIGSVPLTIPPQTSTIASHLPKALGAVLSITRAKELCISSKLPRDSVILCSFGDSSTNHASAQVTFNACSWIADQKYPLPLVFICEDNGIGISVPTPKNWIETSIKCRPHFHYLACDGLNIADCYAKAVEAGRIARTKKQVVFLHMRCVRLLGHAGSDIESQYRSQIEIERIEADDPLLHTARLLYQEQSMTLQDMVDLYEDNRALINAKAIEAVNYPQLNSADAIMSALLPKSRKNQMYPFPDESRRREIFGASYKQLLMKRNLSQHINFALADLLMQ